MTEQPATRGPYESCGERVQVPGQPGVYTRRCGKPSVITRVVGWEHQTVHLCEEHAQATDWKKT
jgi:hypothetical protein